MREALIRKIHTDKSQFFVGSNCSPSRSDIICKVTRISKGKFTFTYLGAPFFFLADQKLDILRI